MKFTEYIKCSKQIRTHLNDIQITDNEKGVAHDVTVQSSRIK